jgi:alcohol dehydrogenase
MSALPSTGVMSRTCVKTADGVVAIHDVEVPEPPEHGVLVQVRLATVCGSDVHIVDDFPMPRGVERLPMGHEAVATVVAAGDSVRTLAEGDRVVASCMYGCGACPNCQRGRVNLCQTYGTIPGMSNVLGGCQGEYIVVPHADVNAAKVPAELTDEHAILATDIMSTGFAAAERGGVEVGDTVAVFAQGPVGLCATAAARARGAGEVIAVEGVAERAEMARRLGASEVLAPEGAVDLIMERTGGRGVDVAIEALGRRETFAAALAVTRLDGTMSSVGVYARERALEVPVGATFYQRRIVTSLCPCGSDRLRALMQLLAHGHADLAALFTHRMGLGEIVAAYELFKERRDGVIKIALVPDGELSPTA